MKTHYLKCLCLLLLVSGNLFAEHLPLDTLLSRYYDKAANLMGEGEYDSAQYYFDKAFTTKGVRSSPVYPILINEQGTLFFYVGEYDKAMEMKKTALACLPEVEDLEKHISVYNDLGILYRRRNMNDSALYYYKKAYEVAVEYKDESWLANLGLNLAVFYFNMSRLADSEKYIDQGVAHIDKADDPYTEVLLWQSRSMIKAELGKMEEAKLSIRRAWKVADEKKIPEWQIRCIPSLMNLYERDGKMDSVMYYMKIGEGLLKKMPETSVGYTAFIEGKAVIDFRCGNYKEALAAFKKLRNANWTLQDLFRKMAVCCQKTGNDALAFAYMDSARMWTDSLRSKDMASNMAEFNIKYQIQETELENARLKQKQLEKDAFWMKVSIAVIMVITALAVLLLILLNKRRMVRARMEQMKRESELDSARKYIEGLESERKRFAKELHDGIANDLLGLQLQMSVSKGKENMGNLGGMVGNMRENVRRISHELMPPEFNRLDLNEILSNYLLTLEENIGMKVFYQADSDADWQKIPHEVSYEVYRIVQELVSNILKSAEASEITFTLSAPADGAFELRVADNGKGMGQSDKQSYGIGLRTIEDRVKSISATFHINSSDKGSEFIFVIPVG